MTQRGRSGAGVDSHPWPRRRLLFPLVTGLGYYLGALIGVAASAMSEGIALFWLPNGILLAALLMVPRRDWPPHLLVVVLAEIAADLPTFTLAQALGFAAANLFECVLAATLLLRVARPFRLDRLRHAVLFGLYGLIVACGLAALLGALVYTSSVTTTTSFWAFWMIWWLGDGLGVLLVTPLLLGWLQGHNPPVRGHVQEAILLPVLAAALSVWVFSQGVNQTDSFPSSPFLLLPLSLWAAVRFGVRGAASMGLLVAAIAITATLYGHGPLVAATPGGTALLLQQYLAAQVFSSIALAALLQELHERNDRLRLRERAIEAIHDGVVILDARAPDMPIAFANPAFEAMPDHAAADAFVRSCRAARSGDDGAAGSGGMCEALREGRSVRTQLHDVRPDGSESWSDLLVAPVRDGRGQITHYVAIQHDMTEVKRSETELRATHEELDRLNRELEARVAERTRELQEANQRLGELASVDSLTGASNRRHFLEQARAEISRAKRQGLPLSVVMLDIDFFKSINDRYGHEAGDKVLISLAATIQADLRAGDIFARLGGEEFILMLPGQDRHEAFRMAERLRVLVAEMVTADCPARITVSAGVASLESETGDVDDLLRRADQALYQAKHQGRNQVCVAHPARPGGG